MSVVVREKWVTVDTENSDAWVDQSYTVKRELISSVRLTKKLANTGCENGLEIILSLQSRIWMRYLDFAKAEADYRTLIQEL